MAGHHCRGPFFVLAAFTGKVAGLNAFGLASCTDAVKRHEQLQVQARVGWRMGAAGLGMGLDVDSSVHLFLQQDTEQSAACMRALLVGEDEVVLHAARDNSMGLLNRPGGSRIPLAVRPWWDVSYTWELGMFGEFRSCILPLFFYE
jgi:hypothetical protein